jgi:DNA helicase-2/ATP-dependent DNA helicase PcrA
LRFGRVQRDCPLRTSTLPSRFVDELPEPHVAVEESKGGFGGFMGYGNVGGSRFDRMETFGSSYGTPGWQRARANRRGFDGEGEADETDSRGDGDSGGPGNGNRNHPGRGKWNRGGGGGGGFREAGPNEPAERSRQSARDWTNGPRAGLTIEGELVAKSTGTVSAFAVGDRVFHQKFGTGNVVHVEGNKLTIAFDRAGEKKVVDSFVARA